MHETFNENHMYLFCLKVQWSASLHKSTLDTNVFCIPFTLLFKIPLHSLSQEYVQFKKKKKKKTYILLVTTTNKRDLFFFPSILFLQILKLSANNLRKYTLWEHGSYLPTLKVSYIEISQKKIDRMPGTL